jgi:hypothetical protein
MKSTVEHVCFSQHLNEKKPRKCTCRKRLTLAQATAKVKDGFAEWIILSTTTTTGKEPCPICAGGPTKKSCQNCDKTGEVEIAYITYKYGNDIVLVTAGTPENGKVTYRSVKSKKTPRVATIEKSHIERAYVSGNKDEQERIEAYGLMTLQARVEMGIGIEPADNPKTGEGRHCDYGRSPFARISDERTSIGTVGLRITEGYKTIEESEIK